MENKRIMVLAPHTDDGELGCGGTISKYCREGKDVFYVAFSACAKSLPKHLAPDTLLKEVKAATETLGIKSENLIALDFDVRTFKQFRQEILEELIKLRNDIKPDVIFVPSPTDIHQDHQTISEEGLRAFKSNTLLGYEMPWNNVSFNTRSFMKLEEQDIVTKVSALGKYKSQAHRSYLNEEFIRSLAITRGVQVGCRYAEAFEVIRMIL